MASIGPQLPPHLQKRKRTPDDDADLGSPPPKTSRRDNHDEIPLDDDTEDGFGPSAPISANRNRGEKTSSRAGPSIGPSLPEGASTSTASSSANKRGPIGPLLPRPLAPTNENEIPLDSDSDSDATGPAPPPTTAGPAAPRKRVIGPAPPPANLSERPPTGPDSASSDDDNDDDKDDDWGPALPAATTSSARPNPTIALPSVPEPPPAAPKRDDWMLAPPPTGGGYRASDPTKLKARKFASGPRAATEAKPAGISSLWTETAEEKARRLANAVLGREDPADARAQAAAAAASTTTTTRRWGPEAGGGKGSSKEDVARIGSFTEQTRGKSLVEEHQAARLAGKKKTSSKGEKGWGGKEDEDEDDPSKRAFDWEKDMKVGGRISNSQRKELLNRAANFGGRFQKGSYL